MQFHNDTTGQGGTSLPDSCPVSGLKLTKRPEWTDIPLVDGYSVTFCFVGDRILLTMPKGYSGNRGMEALFLEREKVINHMLPNDEKYIELRDYAGIRGKPNWNARKQMVRGLRAGQDRLQGFIIFNTPPAVKMVAGIGMRLYRYPFHAYLAADYRDAINRALEITTRGKTGQLVSGIEARGAKAGGDENPDIYIDELIRYLGQINWELDEKDHEFEKPADHPFRPVFDAIDLLKVDLEDLIRERERSLRELLEKETEQRRIIESIDDGYYECDLAGTILVANQAFCRASGFSQDSVVGTNYRDKLDKYNADRVSQAFNQVYRTGLPAHNITYDIVTSEGALCHVEATTSLIRDQQGKPTGFRGIVRDITERRKNEEFLMMFRRFAEASGEGMGWSDLDGRIVYVNETMCRILGEPDRAAARGKRVVDHYDRETRKRLVGEINPVVMEKGEWKGELLLRRTDGQPVPTLNDIFLIRDESGRPIYHAIISRDISDLKKTEQALRQSEEKYRVLYEHAGDIIFVAQDGLIKFPNLKGRSLFGYAKKEVDNTSFLDLIHPDDRDMVLERHMKRMRGEQFEETYSFRIYDKAGKMLWVQITSVFIEWEGRPAALVFLRDITRQKSMEDQLRQKYKMEAVGTLAGGIAHDFNNILAGIMGYTDVIAGGIPEGTMAHKNLTQIRKSVLRARGLVKQLLSFSRSAEQDYSSVSMRQIVIEVLEMIRALSPSAVEIIEEVDKKGCLVYANPVQIHAIVLNLCNNALQAMPDGGRLEVSLEEASGSDKGLPDGTMSAGHYCVLTVHDTGHGMTPDTMERIFEPYFTTRQQVQGTGLGLSMVHGVVTNLGGAVTVESAPGRGSTLRIYLPAMDTDGEPISVSRIE